MAPVRVKICGISSPEDAILACRLGASALGLVFYAGSRRAVSVEQALEIRRQVPPFVALTGLFVDARASEVEQVLYRIRLDCLQFHGEESAAYCDSFGLPYLKAIRVREELDVPAVAAAFPNAAAILLDSYDRHQAGGTGTRFDWSIARTCVERCERPIVLAGGLNADNIARAIAEVRPYAVDVSSGVESKPGQKCPQKMKAFFQEVYRAN